MRKKKVFSKISISLDEELLNDLNTLVELKRLTRSNLIASLISDEVLKHREEIKKYRDEQSREKENLNDKVENLMLKEKW